MLLCLGKKIKKLLWKQKVLTMEGIRIGLFIREHKWNEIETKGIGKGGETHINTKNQNMPKLCWEKIGVSLFYLFIWSK
jgi:hypothetical protein